MGRQITVALDALDVLCHLDYYEEVVEVPRETWSGQDAYEDVTLRFVTVCTPEWQSITLSVYGRDACFDCRGPGSPNHWFEEWMVNNKVLYLDS